MAATEEVAEARGGGGGARRRGRREGEAEAAAWERESERVAAALCSGGGAKGWWWRLATGTCHTYRCATDGDQRSREGYRGGGFSVDAFQERLRIYVMCVLPSVWLVDLEDVCVGLNYAVLVLSSLVE